MVLPLALYVGSYAALRARGRLVLIRFSARSEVYETAIDVVLPSAPGGRKRGVIRLQESHLFLAYRPCIAIEEWWRN